MTNYYTYILTDSTTRQPFYVGKGAGSRMYQHLKESQRDDYTKRSIHYKILSILKEGGKIVYTKYEMESEEAAFAEEKRLIALYGRKDNGTGILCNLTDGGEGGSNKPQEVIERVAAFHRGRKRSEESKERMKKAQIIIAERNRELYGTGVKPETIQKMSANRKGKPWSENARAVKRDKPTAKPVLVYKKDTGEFIGEWESISLCAKELNVDTTSVWKICEKIPMNKSSSGKKYPMKSFKGYTFRYKYD